MTHPKWERRLDWMHKLDAAVPDKYCWAGLASVAMFGTDTDSARCAEYCRLESLKIGSCYCGKFQHGLVWYVPGSTSEQEAMER